MITDNKHICKGIFKENKNYEYWNYEGIKIIKINNKWTLTICYPNDYPGDEREIDIQFCPFCGEELK